MQGTPDISDPKGFPFKKVFWWTFAGNPILIFLYFHLWNGNYLWPVTRWDVLGSMLFVILPFCTVIWVFTLGLFLAPMACVYLLFDLKRSPLPYRWMILAEVSAAALMWWGLISMLELLDQF